MMCDFPSRELRAIRDLTSAMLRGRNVEQVKPLMAVIVQIDKLKWEHKTSGCDCWWTVRNENPDDPGETPVFISRNSLVQAESQITETAA